jgi:hypothetical protein
MEGNRFGHGTPKFVAHRHHGEAEESVWQFQPVEHRLAASFEVLARGWARAVQLDGDSSRQRANRPPRGRIFRNDFDVVRLKVGRC